jgi:hypothetical protein
METTMTNSSQGSAQILEFPARGRFAASGQRDEPETTAILMRPRVGNVACGSGWYHEEAIQEAERAGKN